MHNLLAFFFLSQVLKSGWRLKDRVRYQRDILIQKGRQENKVRRSRRGETLKNEKEREKPTAADGVGYKNKRGGASVKVQKAALKRRWLTSHYIPFLPL